jgi:hypothetical protein
MAGGCSATPQKVAVPIDCTPIIETYKELVPVPDELTAIHYNPGIPFAGTNANLLDWAQSCAVNTRLYEEQMRLLKELK